MSKVKDETGNVYGQLTVLKRVEKASYGRHAFWLCQCECGNKPIVSGTSLRDGRTKTCGCVHSRQLPPGQAAFNALYCNYRINARNKGRIFELTKEDFSFITKMNCHYCGIEPLQISCYRGLNGDYTHNGVDRVDSKKGYTLDNVVPCCSMCNIAKKNFTRKEFLSWVNRVYSYQHRR